MDRNDIAEAINNALEQHEERVRLDRYVCAALTGLCAGSTDAAKDVDFLGVFSVEIAKRAIAEVDAPDMWCPECNEKARFNDRQKHSGKPGFWHSVCGHNLEEQGAKE